MRRDKRDRLLLMEMLTPEQRATFTQDSYILCKSNKGRTFRVRTTEIRANVDWVNVTPSGIVRLGTYTAFPYRFESKKDVTNYGIWLGQLLQLQIDEEGFLGLACKQYGSYPREYNPFDYVRRLAVSTYASGELLRIPTQPD